MVDSDQVESGIILKNLKKS